MARNARSRNAKPKPSREPGQARPGKAKPAAGPAARVADEPGAAPHPQDEVTSYESDQIRQIAAWKAEEPHRRSGPIGKAAEAVAHFAERYIPSRVAQEAIDRVYQEAELSSHRGDIERHAGVTDLGELKHHPLEECDQLASGVVAWAQGLAIAGGAVTGAGGFLTSALDVPLLLTLSLRTIIRVGHCYGYSLDRPEDRRAVLGILMVAATDDPGRKMSLLTQLREVEDWMLEQAEEELIEDEALELLLQVEIFDDIPGLGAITAGIGNFAFIHHASNASRRVFQEWWLRDNGKVTRIAPVPLDPATVEPSWRSGLASRAVYVSFYYLGFGASLPVWLVAHRLKGVDNALTRGAKDGAIAAVAGADATWDRLRHLAAPAPESPAIAALPAG